MRLHAPLMAVMLLTETVTAVDPVLGLLVALLLVELAALPVPVPGPALVPAPVLEQVVAAAVVVEVKALDRASAGRMCTTN